jgi:hypothetical protein
LDLVITSILFAGFAFFLLALLLARYGGHPNRLTDQGGAPGLLGHEPPVLPARFRTLVRELLAAMDITTAPLPGEEQRLSGRRPNHFHDVRYVIFLEPEPPGDLVEQTDLLELAETAKAQGASVGMLVTPYDIDQSGLANLPTEVELIDGAKLRQLFARYLPERMSELEQYRGFGKGRPLAPSTPAPIPGYRSPSLGPETT